MAVFQLVFSTMFRRGFGSGGCASYLTVTQVGATRKRATTVIEQEAENCLNARKFNAGVVLTKSVSDLFLGTLRGARHVPRND